MTARIHLIRFSASICILLGAAGILVPSATAAPQGRAWTPTATLNMPGFWYLGVPRMEVDHTGTPTLATIARGPSLLKDAFGFRWNGLGWSPTWRLGKATGALWPVGSPDTTYHLVWTGIASDNYLYMARASGTEVVGIDTIAIVASNRSEYAAAVSAQRRWAVISDLNPNLTLRAFYSDVPGQWSEIPAVGLGDNGVTISALDDTTALVASSSLHNGIRWGYIRGTEWVSGDFVPFSTLPPARLRLRDHPEGGKWLVWAEPSGHVGMSRFLDGAWGPIDTLRCDYTSPEIGYSADSPDLSRDSAVRPAVAWGWQNGFGITGVCVCIPTEDGYPLAESIPDPLGSGVAASVAVDPNGDVWLGWWSFLGPMFWIHTYVTTTTASLSATGDWDSRTVEWDLSEAAPNSWWAVLRADDAGGEFAEVARVQAGQDLHVAWIDSSLATGVLRYRIRRESVDRAYEWLSDEVVWDQAVPVQLALASAEADPDRVRLRWLGAGAGNLDATVHRRLETSDWQSVGLAESIGADQLFFEDRAVMAGQRYAYRLLFSEQGVPKYTSEAWVQVPGAFSFSLGGFQPNPAVGPTSIAFTLPSAAPTSLEILDISGRSVVKRNLGALGAGRHLLSVGVNLAPGAYVIRLTHGGRTLTTRGVAFR